MSEYMEFKTVQCKDCYRCVRECPVKAIEVKGHHAQIIEDHCILCGHCTHVCPQNAKIVHSELPLVRQLLASGDRIAASVAPSFISSLRVKDFNTLHIALAKLGFSIVEETALGAQAVVEEYKKVLAKGEMRNFITSACPAACRLIQMYYPKALPYLAPVESPMVAHAKMLRRNNPDMKIVFIGPCIAKKREADEHNIDAVLTFEELLTLLNENNIDLSNISLKAQASTDWKVTFDEDTISDIPAGQSKEVTAHITPAKDAILGDYAVLVTASNEVVKSECDLRVAVQNHTGWGIVAVVIIAALVAGLVYIIRKFGRR